MLSPGSYQLSFASGIDAHMGGGGDWHLMYPLKTIVKSCVNKNSNMRDHLLTVSQPHGSITQDFPRNLSPPSSNTPIVLTSVHPMPARDHLLIGRNVFGRTEGNKRLLVKLLSTWEKFGITFDQENTGRETQLDDK